MLFIALKNTDRYDLFHDVKAKWYLGGNWLLQDKPLFAKYQLKTSLWTFGEMLGEVHKKYKSRYLGLYVQYYVCISLRLLRSFAFARKSGIWSFVQVLISFIQPSMACLFSSEMKPYLLIRTCIHWNLLSLSQAITLELHRQCEVAHSTSPLTIHPTKVKEDMSPYEVPKC